MENPYRTDVFNGMRALVCGASKGIGRATAELLATCGAEVFAVSRSAPEITGCTSIPCDLENETERKAMMENILDGGPIHILVNNAGITSIGRADLLDATEENWDTLMAINLKGPFFLSQLAARWMVEQFEADTSRKAKIINISSVSAYAVSTNRGDYCVAKAGLGMVTRLFAARLAEDGINVYEVCPGVIASDMTAPVREKYDKLITDGMAPIRRWGEPGDVGKAVVALARDFFPFTTGEVFNVDGGFNIRKL